MARLFLVNARVLENKFISHYSKNYKVISFTSMKIATAFSPGQFVTIDCGTYLRRPFSISGVYGEKVEVIYKVLGIGTRFLASIRKGQRINVLGPLGNGFSLPQKDSSVVAVAGGTGIAPVTALAQRLKKPGALFYGTKTKSEICDVTLFENKGWSVSIATEDGSAGEKGTALQLLLKFLLRFGGVMPKAPDISLYAAGPRKMLSKISGICIKNDINGQVSVEEMVACGVGACRGCVIRVKGRNGGYENKTVCKDGPVFDAARVIWQ